MSVSKVPPKSTRIVYKGTVIVLTYIPEGKRWKWEFILTPRIPFTDFADSEKAAALEAKRELDVYFASMERSVRKHSVK